MMLQLNPPIPVITPKGKGLAHILVDYGSDHDLIWIVFQNDGQCWCWQNTDIRGQSNITYGRSTSSEFLGQ